LNFFFFFPEQNPATPIYFTTPKRPKETEKGGTMGMGQGETRVECRDDTTMQEHDDGEYERGEGIK
jgi:hypothetical protein